MKERFDEKYLKIGMTLFTAGCGIILFYLVLGHLPVLAGTVGRLRSIVSPFIYGFVMAFLLCPVYNQVTRRTYHALSGKMKKKRAFGLSKGIATVVSLALLIFVVSFVLSLIIPQMIDSITALINLIPGRITQLTAWLSSVIDSSEHPQIVQTINDTLNNSYDYILKLVSEHIMPGIDGYVQKISQGLILTVRTALNLLIGVIACAYFLNGKEHFKAQAAKLVTALFRRSTAESIFEFGNFANKTFGGFINGKIIDSIIIGIICFFLMSILHLPYPALCSTIVGVTNIIPCFGPFIGAIPSAIIICVVDPIQAGEFLILVILLQQFDGNILGPFILGESIGLGSFWIMFSIILFGGLFGFAGMLLGAPVFAIFYHYFNRYLEKRLGRKGLAENTAEYQEYNVYDINRKDLL